MKTPFAVWESEYPEEGSILVFAITPKGARRRYRRSNRERSPGVAALVPLSLSALSMEQALALARSSQ
jgi:hypothetical protein